MSERELGFVHKFVPGADDSEVMLFLLHGTGGTESDLLSLGQSISYGAALLSPRGKVLENGMTRFFRRVAFNVFDLKDIKLRANELADFLEQAKAEYAQSDKSVVAVGYSNGANAALAMLTLRPDLLAGAILFRSNAPALADSIPNLAGKSIFVAAGRFDEYVEPERSELLARSLQDAGAEVTLNWSEVGHGLVREEIDAARRWLQTRFSAKQVI